MLGTAVCRGNPSAAIAPELCRRSVRTVRDRLRPWPGSGPVPAHGVAVGASDRAVALTSAARDIDDDVLAVIAGCQACRASAEAVHAACRQVQSCAHGDDGAQHVGQGLVGIAVVQVPAFAVVVDQPWEGRGVCHDRIEHLARCSAVSASTIFSHSSMTARVSPRSVGVRVNPIVIPNSLVRASMPSRSSASRLRARRRAAPHIRRKVELHKTITPGGVMDTRAEREHIHGEPQPSGHSSTEADLRFPRTGSPCAEDMPTPGDRGWF